MKRILIQYQPSDDSKSEKEEVFTLLGKVGLDSEVSEGDDGGRYINFMISTATPTVAWNKIRETYLIDSKYAGASIVVCEGDNGWDDYLLLHHFDESERLDDF